MPEPIQREIELAAEIDRGLLAIEGRGLIAEAHSVANQALIAGALASYREEVLGERRSRGGRRRKVRPIVACGCGCGVTFEQYDHSRRPRRYVAGHNRLPSPTMDVLRAALAVQDGTVVTLAGRLGRTKRALSTCLSKMKSRGMVSFDNGIWSLARASAAASAEQAVAHG
jgi:hypothetical protein